MIRRATPADAEAVARVQVATWRAAYAGLIPAPVLDALSVPAGTARWDGLLRDPAVPTWVAEDGAEVVGFATAGPARDADAPGAGEIYAAYVLPEAQGSGRGRALLDAGLAWMETAGHVCGTLWVLTANAAGRAFYEACGWRPDGAARGIDVGGAVVDEVRYRISTRATRVLTAAPALR
ncbi:MAG TPA: GNAT family N-acetyltransferase [Frankiaceae bacterium]|nr:GNAT family N-acetyltransferase [Frankiaceae bacterium]